MSQLEAVRRSSSLHATYLDAEHAAGVLRGALAALHPRCDKQGAQVAAAEGQGRGPLHRQLHCVQLLPCCRSTATVQVAVAQPQCFAQQ